MFPRGKAALIRNMKARSSGGVSSSSCTSGGVGGGSLSERQPCAYSQGVCSGRRLDHYDYCLKHILEDKSAPYRQCNFTAPKTNRRCTNPAPKSDRKEGRFCKEHAKRAVLSRQKASRKSRPRETAETLLEELTLSAASASDASNDTKRLRRPADSIASKALEYASSSDSDTEVPSVDQAWRRDNDSDAESIDSEHEDPLKHAGVYSQEEAALLLRDKLIRLQSLYIDQFKRLQHVLKEKRRHFLHTYRQEREMLGPIQAYKQDPTQRKKYERLQAMRRYHKFFGKEALLHRKCNQRRTAVAEGVNHRPPVFTRCAVATPDGRCNKKVLPQSRYCMAHILQDPHQVLFEACRFRNGQCAEPVFSLDEVPLCRRHYAAAASASSSSSSSTSCAVQTEDLSQESAEADVKIEVDDVPSSCGHETLTPALTASGGQQCRQDGRPQGTGDSGPLSCSGMTQGSQLDTPSQGTRMEDDTHDNDNNQDIDQDNERLDSSGEAALDIPLLNVSMDEDDLIRFVEGEHVDSFDSALNQQPPSQ